MIQTCQTDSMGRILPLVAARKKAWGRGGWRPGSGRKPVLKDAVSVTLDLERESHDALEALAAVRSVPRAELIRDAIRRYLAAALRRGR
jgi:hypothetical protein